MRKFFAFLSLVCIALFMSITPAQAIITRKITGNASFVTKVTCADLYDQRGFELKGCIQIGVVTQWIPDGFIGGTMTADVYVIGHNRLYNLNGSHVWPSKAKWFLSNTTNGEFHGNNDFCGWPSVGPCKSYAKDMNADLFNFSWPYHFSRGCGAMTIHGNWQVSVWPAKLRPWIMFYYNLNIWRKVVVCSPGWLN